MNVHNPWRGTSVSFFQWIEGWRLLASTVWSGIGAACAAAQNAAMRRDWEIFILMVSWGIEVFQKIDGGMIVQEPCYLVLQSWCCTLQKRKGPYISPKTAFTCSTSSKIKSLHSVAVLKPVSFLLPIAVVSSTVIQRYFRDPKILVYVLENLKLTAKIFGFQNQKRNWIQFYHGSWIMKSTSSKAFDCLLLSLLWCWT